MVHSTTASEIELTAACGSRSASFASSRDERLREHLVLVHEEQADRIRMRSDESGPDGETFLSYARKAIPTGGMGRRS